AVRVLAGAFQAGRRDRPEPRSFRPIRDVDRWPPRCSFQRNLLSCLAFWNTMVHHPCPRRGAASIPGCAAKAREGSAIRPLADQDERAVRTRADAFALRLTEEPQVDRWPVRGKRVAGPLVAVEGAVRAQHDASRAGSATGDLIGYLHEPVGQVL